jgi:CBS domain-containing protein
MKEKTVKDLMLSLDEYATVSADSTIQEALMVLDKAQLGLTYNRHHHRAVLVLDENKNVIGKLSHWAVLRSLEPKFLKTDDLESLSRAGLTQDFIETLKEGFSVFTTNFRQMCDDSARIKVKDALVPLGEAIDEESPLTKAIQKLVQNHAQSMLVTRQGEVVGILRLSDVFEEVAELIKEAGNK